MGRVRHGSQPTSSCLPTRSSWLPTHFVMPPDLVRHGSQPTSSCLPTSFVMGPNPLRHASQPVRHGSQPTSSCLPTSFVMGPYPLRHASQPRSSWVPTHFVMLPDLVRHGSLPTSSCLPTRSSWLPTHFVMPPNLVRHGSLPASQASQPVPMPPDRPPGSSLRPRTPPARHRDARPGVCLAASPSRARRASTFPQFEPWHTTAWSADVSLSVRHSCHPGCGVVVSSTTA
jgi:hypothetical protein